MGNSFGAEHERGSYSNAVVRLGRTSGGGLGVMSWYQPPVFAARDDVDDDLGSGGPMLLPDTRRLVVGGKRGTLFLQNRDALGMVTSCDTATCSIGCVDGAVDTLDLNAARGASQTCTGSVHVSHGAVHWAGGAEPRFYTWASGLGPRAHGYGTGAMTELDGHPASAALANGRTVVMSLSADGTRAGSGVLWAIGYDCSSGATSRGALLAYDALNLAAGPIWTSSQVTEDALGEAPKFAAPTIAGGRVYVGTFSNRVAVYGRLAAARAVLREPMEACTQEPPPPSACTAPASSYTNTPTWNNIYTDVLRPSCRSCHSGSVTTSAGWQVPGMGDTPASMFDAWTSPSRWPAGRGPLVSRCAPLSSWVVDPATSPLSWVRTGGTMPLGTVSRPCSNPAGFDAIRRWIEAGARDPSGALPTCP
jgi:hypothetical protein